MRDRKMQEFVIRSFNFRLQSLLLLHLSFYTLNIIILNAQRIFRIL